MSKLQIAILIAVFSVAAGAIAYKHLTKNEQPQSSNTQQDTYNQMMNDNGHRQRHRWTRPPRNIN